MKRTAILAAAGFLVAGVSSGQDFHFDPEKSATGSVVRITALRPPITLSRALVIQCTTSTITVGRERDRFVVQSSNVLEFELLQAAPKLVAVTNETGKVEMVDSKKVAEAADKVSLWQRVLGYFKR